MQQPTVKALFGENHARRPGHHRSLAARGEHLRPRRQCQRYAADGSESFEVNLPRVAGVVEKVQPASDSIALNLGNVQQHYGGHHAVPVGDMREEDCSRQSGRHIRDERRHEDFITARSQLHCGGGHWPSLDNDEAFEV